MSLIQKHNIKISGNGKDVMLFAHGFGCDQNMWRFVKTAFEENYKVIAFDYIGSGKSDPAAYNTEKYSSLNGYADDVIEICKELGLSNVIFVGHSVSSMIGIIASNREPGMFSKLIMVGPSARYLNDEEYVGGFERSDIEELLGTMDKNYIGWANYLAPVVMKNSERPELTAELEESFCSTDPVIARKFAEVTFLSDNRKDISQLRVPSLIMQCADDIIAPSEVGDFLKANIPQSTLVHMKATGHCPHLSHPDETIQLIKKYLFSQASQ